LQAGPTFGTDYIGIEAKPSPRGEHLAPNPEAVAAVLDKVTTFERKHRETMQLWGQKLEAYRQQGKRVLGWGAGARAIAFLSAFGVTDAIANVVDTNPNRQSKYLPVTGQKVVPPEFVVDYSPDVVLITNPSFTEEIKAQARALGANPVFEAL